MSGRRTKKKTKDDAPEDSANQKQQPKQQRKRGNKLNTSGIAQRLNMIIDNLTFDEESPEKHVRRNVATAIKHLQGIVTILDGSQ